MARSPPSAYNPTGLDLCLPATPTTLGVGPCARRRFSDFGKEDHAKRFSHGRPQKAFSRSSFGAEKTRRAAGCLVSRAAITYPSRTALFRLYNSAMPKYQKEHIPLLLDLVPLACATLAIVGLMFGTGVALLGHRADIPPKPSVSGANVSSLIARPQSDLLLRKLSVGSIAAKAAVNPSLGGTPAHLHEAFALNADADGPQFTAPTVSSKRWPVVPPRKAQSN